MDSQATPVLTSTPPQRSPRKKLVGSVVAVAVMVALGGLAWHLTHRPDDSAGGAGPGGKRGAAGRPGGDVPSTVGVATAEKADVPVVLDALGTVTAAATTTVRAQVSGILQKVLFTEGQMVKAGQVLAQIDPRQFEMALLQATGQRQRDEAQLDIAKLTLTRYQTLLKQDSIALQDVDTQAALVKQLDGTVKTDVAAEGAARLNLGYTKVVAPISGRVGLRAVDIGNLVSSGDANGLATITELSPIDVEFSIPQDNVPEVQQRSIAGNVLPAVALDRTRVNTLDTGHFAALDNQVDTQTGTVKAKARFANAKFALFPSQFVNVRLELRTIKDAVMVPVTALRHGANGDFVYVLKADKTVSLRPVTRGQATVDKVQISTGLQVGAFGDDLFADLQAGADLDLVDGGLAARDGAQRDRLVGLEHVDEIAVGAVAQRRHRHHHRILDGAQLQAHVDELAGEQRELGVGEARLGLDGAGLRVDLVVERGEMAGVERIDAGAVQRHGRQHVAGDGALLHFRHIVLRDGEFDVDRRQLGDGGQAVGVTGADQVTDIDGAQADAAADRRDDLGVAQVQARRTFGRDVGLDGAVELLDQRGLRVDVLQRDRVLLEQGLIARQRQLGDVELRLVALALAGGLQQRHLELARVDLGQHLAGLDHLALGEQNLLQNARHLRAHRRGGRRRDRAEGVQHHRHIGFFRRRHAHRARHIAARTSGRTTLAARAGAAGAVIGTMGQVPGEAAQCDHHGHGDHAADQFLARAALRRSACQYGRCLRIHLLSLCGPRGRGVYSICAAVSASADHDPVVWALRCGDSSINDLF